MNDVGTYSVWVQEVGADLRCKCSGVFRARAQVGLHRQVKQLWKTDLTVIRRASKPTTT